MPTATALNSISHPTIPYFNMVQIPAGKFMMGGRDENELPVHEVNVPEFYMGQYPVTQGLWHAVTGQYPLGFKGTRRPVEQVSWDDIRQGDGFLEKLNQHAATRKWLEKAGLGEWQFCLPTEAEWEYAARGGENYEYAGSDSIDEVAWYGKHSHGETKPVGLKAPNGFGLYDMSGNVWEWCEDDWHDTYKEAPRDGGAWVQDPGAGQRLLRGGCWSFNPGLCRVSCRIGFYPGLRYNIIGFRLALRPSLTAEAGG